MFKFWAACESGDIHSARQQLAQGADPNRPDLHKRTPVGLALAGGHFQLVRLLVDRGADLNTKDGSRRTPIEQAAEAGLVKTIRFCIRSGFLEFHQPDSAGHDLLFIAVRCGHMALAKTLVAAGANPFITDGWGTTLLHTAASYGHIRIVKWLLHEGLDVNHADPRAPLGILALGAWSGKLQLVKELLAAGADVQLGYPLPLYKAVGSGKLAVVRLLVEHGIRINPPPDYDNKLNPLLAAIKTDNINIVRYLLSQGADPDSRNGFENALQLALKKVNFAMIRMLIDAGANLQNLDLTPLVNNQKHHLLRFLFNLGVSPDNGNRCLTPLQTAVKYADLTTARLLVRHGAALKPRPDYRDRYPLLNMAAETGSVPMIEFLLKAGADPNERDYRKYNMLDVMIVKMSDLMRISWQMARRASPLIPIIYRLIRANQLEISAEQAKFALHLAIGQGDLALTRRLFVRFPQAINNFPGVRFESPLILAAERGGQTLARELLNAGADPNGQDESGRTPLFAACARGDLKLTKLLLAHGADPGIPTSFNATCLQAAARTGPPALVKLLLRGRHPHPEVQTCTPAGAETSKDSNHLFELARLGRGIEPDIWMPAKHSTPLHEAAIGGSMEIFECLLASEFSERCRDSDDNLPLHLAARFDHWHILHRLLGMGVSVDTPGWQGTSALCLACLAGARDAAAGLADNGADVQWLDAWGNSPLHYAAVGGTPELADLLFTQGTPVDATETSRGWTALHLAIEAGNAPMARWLVTRGADLDLPDKEGTTPRHLARSGLNPFLIGTAEGDPMALLTELNDFGSRQDSRIAGGGAAPSAIPLKEAAIQIEPESVGRSALHQAAAAGNLPEVESLIRKGAQPDAANKEGEIPHHLALRNEHVSVARFLVVKGARLNLRDKQGFFPINRAVEQREWTMVDEMLERGADINARLKKRETFPEIDAGTMLHLYTVRSAVSTVQHLVRRGAAVNVRTRAGRTPLHNAAFRSAQPDDLLLVQFLLASGADVNARERGGETPLHLAARYGRLESVKALVAAGADIRARNRWGATPCQRCQSQESQDIRRYLEELEQSRS